MKDLPYTERLTALELPSLYDRCAKGDMIETYEHISGMYAIDAEYIKPDKSLTWGYSSRIRKKRSIKNI